MDGNPSCRPSDLEPHCFNSGRLEVAPLPKRSSGERTRGRLHASHEPLAAGVDANEVCWALHGGVVIAYNVHPVPF